MHILISGNPVDGFQFEGPYETHEDAVVAGDHRHSGDWWIGYLDAPKKQVSQSQTNA